VLVSLFTANLPFWWATRNDWSDGSRSTAGFSLLGFLVCIAGVSLLVTRQYPRALFDLVVGLNRWVYRVVVYVALMRDEYPPFLLEQGAYEGEGVGHPSAPTYT
jgi:hypothetical protein